MRLSRPCYDKPHRCPGWAGGGTKGSKVDRCDGGSIRTRGLAIGEEDGRRVVYGEYPGTDKWRFGHCTDCDVLTWPVALCHMFDPGWWRWELSSLRTRIEDSWDDFWNHGESLRRIYQLRWR